MSQRRKKRKIANISVEDEDNVLNMNGKDNDYRANHLNIDFRDDFRSFLVELCVDTNSKSLKIKLKAIMPLQDMRKRGDFYVVDEDIVINNNNNEYQVKRGDYIGIDIDIDIDIKDVYRSFLVELYIDTNSKSRGIKSIFRESLTVSRPLTDRVYKIADILDIIYLIVSHILLSIFLLSVLYINENKNERVDNRADYLNIDFKDDFRSFLTKLCTHTNLKSMKIKLKSIFREPLTVTRKLFDRVYKTIYLLWIIENKNGEVFKKAEWYILLHVSLIYHPIIQDILCENMSLLETAMNHIKLKQEIDVLNDINIITEADIKFKFNLIIMKKIENYKILIAGNKSIRNDTAIRCFYTLLRQVMDNIYPIVPHIVLLVSSVINIIIDRSFIDHVIELLDFKWDLNRDILYMEDIILNIEDIKTIKYRLVSNNGSRYIDMGSHMKRKLIYLVQEFILEPEQIMNMLTWNNIVDEVNVEDENNTFYFKKIYNRFFDNDPKSRNIIRSLSDELNIHLDIQIMICNKVNIKLGHIMFR